MNFKGDRLSDAGGSGSRDSDWIAGAMIVHDREFGSIDSRNRVGQSVRRREQSNDVDGEILGLSPERVEEIRRRIEDGTYNSFETAEAVARRLVARGDL